MTELMVGLAVAGVGSLVLIPKIQIVIDRAQVKSARTAMYNRFAAARLAAQQGGRVVIFRVSGSQIWSEAQPRLIPAFSSTKDTLGSVTDLTSEFKVSVSTTVDSIIFDPRGLGTGNGAVRFTRGSQTDSVTVVGLGGVIR